MNNSSDDYKCDWETWWEEMNPLTWRVASWLTAQYLFRFLKNLEIKSMLELGGGSGLTAKHLAQKLGAQLTLLDNNPGAYRAFRRFSNYGEYIRKDFFHFKADKRWDLVYSLGVIEHFPKQKRIEAVKIHKNLSRKYVLVLVPADSGLWGLIRKWRHSRTISFEKLYSLCSLKQELQKAGLEPWRIGKNIALVCILSKI